MKTIGLLGGISWVSTHMYYELLNRASARRRGAGHQAPLLLKSFDYQVFFELHKAGREDQISADLAKGARDLESIGADVIAICANTMHQFYDDVQGAIDIPVLHVADACGQAISKAGFTTATLLGTKYTMEREFYRTWLRDKHGVETIVPDEAERDTIEHVIRQELTRNIVSLDSRKAFTKIIGRCSGQGSQCAILGCTEIGLLLKQTDTTQPLFDTTELRAEALVEWALS